MTIEHQKSSSEVVKEILTSKAPELSNTQLKSVSTVITAAIEKTDKNCRDRVCDLITAMEQSPALQRALADQNRSKLEDELFRETLRNVINWFLSTAPPRWKNEGGLRHRLMESYLWQ
jgi:hypothetical protein